MNQHKTTPEAYRLLHEGAQALSRVEANGIRIDLAYLKQAVAKVDAEVGETQRRMASAKEMGLWRRRFGNKTNPDSRDQVAEVVFGVLGHEARTLTDGGRRFKADKSALEAVDLPFVQDFLKVQSLKKAKSTYLLGILKEVDAQGYVHPFFHLNTVTTYRSSASNPNTMNLPVREPWLAEVVRNCYIPRPGHAGSEVDYGGIEVKAAAFYHRDPAMMAYIKDPGKDMHRDMAAECFLIAPELVSKTCRYVAKNQFVFPQFYGSFYVDCARAMWESTERLKLKVGKDDSGVSIRDHLKSKGIRSLGLCDPDTEPEKGTFEYHVREVERKFWQKRFPVYAKWKKSWFEEYQKTGGFTMKTGFAVNAVLKRNDVINYPVQGVAFHCLLRSLTVLQSWLQKHRFKTRIVNEVHDSMWFDGPERELKDVAEKAREIMTVQVPGEWRWINVPLDVELEVAPTGKSWAEKKVLEF